MRLSLPVCGIQFRFVVKPVENDEHSSDKENQSRSGSITERKTKQEQLVSCNVKLSVAWVCKPIVVIFNNLIHTLGSHNILRHC